MSADSDDGATSPGVPSNGELAERVAGLEETVDHQTEILERIEDNVLGEVENVEDEVERVEGELSELADDYGDVSDEHDTLWTVYQGGKWLLLVVSGGGVLAQFV